MLALIGIVVGAWLILGVVLALVMDAVYTDKALPGTTIAGHDISGMTHDEVDQTMTKAEDTISLSLTAGGMTHEAQGSWVGITVNREDVLATVSTESDKPFWIYRSHLTQIPLTVSIDHEAFDSWAIATFPDIFALPVNASVTFDPTTNSYVTTPAAPGHLVSEGDFATIAATLAVQSGRGDFTLAPATIAADVGDEQAETTRDWINQRLATPCSFGAAGQALYTLAPADIASVTMIGVDPEAGLTATFDPDAIRRFIEAVLAPAVDTAPTVRQVVTDANGTVVSVTQEGQAGRSLTAIDSLADSVAQCLEAGDGSSIELTFSELPSVTEQTALQHPPPPAGSENAHWADVNLTTQTVTLMAGSSPSSTFVMSSGSPTSPTPEGTFPVYAKVPSQSLTGCVEDDCYHYDDVHWATWFYQDYGFHTAYWHEEFGSPISHGCLNMREAEAQAVFDWLSIGSQVLVHV